MCFASKKLDTGDECECIAIFSSSIDLSISIEMHASVEGNGGGWGRRATYTRHFFFFLGPALGRDHFLFFSTASAMYTPCAKLSRSGAAYCAGGRDARSESSTLAGVTSAAPQFINTSK